MSELTLLQRLLAVEAEGFSDVWKEFLMNVEQVRSLGEIGDRQAVRSLLMAGRSWNGSGWNTGKASRQLHPLTTVPLVSGTFGQYLNAFLYSLALWFGIDVDTMDFTEQAAEAVFALAQVYQGGTTGVSAAVKHHEPDTVVDMESEFTMEWDEVEEQLAPELLYLFNAVAKGERRLELREVLQGFSKCAHLPGKPPENNHRGDQAGYLDKERKTQQQSLLHGMPMTEAVCMVINSSLDPAMI